MDEKKPQATETAGPGAKAIENIKELLQEAAGAIPEQDAVAKTLYRLLSNAPLDAQIWDVLGLTLKACRAMGLPPALAGVPGKSLVAKLYAQYVEEKGSLPRAESKDEQGKRLEQYTDLCELLADAIKHTFRQYEQALQTGSVGCP